MARTKQSRQRQFSGALQLEGRKRIVRSACYGKGWTLGISNRQTVLNGGYLQASNGKLVEVVRGTTWLLTH